MSGRRSASQPRVNMKHRASTTAAASSPQPVPGVPAQADARRGERPQGSGQGRAAQSSGQGSAASAAGNAAVSNFPGQVGLTAPARAELSRPRPGANASTGERCMFPSRSRPNGGVPGVSVVRSSGHAILDEAARQTVQRAAPFPAIPTSGRSVQLGIHGATRLFPRLNSGLSASDLCVRLGPVECAGFFRLARRRRVLLTLASRRNRSPDRGAHLARPLQHCRISLPSSAAGWTCYCAENALRNRCCLFRQSVIQSSEVSQQKGQQGF